MISSARQPLLLASASDAATALDVSNLDAEHLLIPESLEEHGKLLVDPPSRTTIVVGEDAATVATAPSVAYQGSAAVFQRRARRTLLEKEQDEVVVRKGDRGLPGSKIYVANRIAATQSLSSKFLGSFHLQSKNAAGENV